MNILLKWLVTSVSLLIISKLPTGVEIDSFQKAAISAIVFGILNVLLVPILEVLSLPMALIFSSFFLSLLMNMIIFGLAAWLVEGFRLRWGIWSALLGSLALSFINSIFLRLLAV
ncbi:MAG: phage holin family protein [Prochloraceae cyanobacterium]